MSKVGAMRASGDNSTRWLWWVIAGAVVLRLVLMAWLPLMDSTEARYAEISRKMLELGDWITPWHDYGVPFWGKPPLAFWLTAGSFQLFGVNELSARLPHFLCMVLVAWAAWGMAAPRAYREAVLTVALLTGAALFFVSAGAVMTDEALVVGTTLAMRGFWCGLHQTGARGMRERGLLFLGLGIGLLAKGPLALVLILLPLVLWAGMTRRWAEIWRVFPWGWGLLAAMLLAAPWYLAAEMKTPGFLQYFLAGEHWHRFVTPGWKGDLYGNAHRFPPGTIWLFAIMAMLPWSILLPITAWQGRSVKHLAPMPVRDAAARNWEGYLLCWALLPLLFFTAARNIIWTYALPSLPALALLAATWLARTTSVRRANGVVIAGLIFSILVGLGFGVQVHRSDIGERRSAKNLVQTWLAQRGVGEPLVVVGTRRFSAAFYSGGQALQAKNVEQVAGELAQRSGYVGVRHRDAEAISSLGRVRLVERFGPYDLLYLSPAQ